MEEALDICSEKRLSETAGARGGSQRPWPGHVGPLATPYKTLSRGSLCTFCPAPQKFSQSWTNRKCHSLVYISTTEMILHSKILHIWHQDLHKKIATILKLSVATDKLLEDWGPANGYLAVPAQPHKDLLEKGFAMCTLYCQVSQKMKDLDIRVFNVTSKLHQTEHVFLLAKSIHPYLCWNFRGEEYMGTMSISGCLEYKHVAIL